MRRKKNPNYRKIALRLPDPKIKRGLKISRVLIAKFISQQLN